MKKKLLSVLLSTAMAASAFAGFGVTAAAEENEDKNDDPPASATTVHKTSSFIMIFIKPGALFAPPLLYITVYVAARIVLQNFSESSICPVHTIVNVEQFYWSAD